MNINLVTTHNPNDGPMKPATLGVDYTITVSRADGGRIGHAEARAVLQAFEQASKEKTTRKQRVSQQNTVEL